MSNKSEIINLTRSGRTQQKITTPYIKNMNELEY